MINELNIKNNFKIYPTSHNEFKNYGRVLSSYKISEIQSYMEEHTSIPQEGNIYVASVQKLKSTIDYEFFKQNVYGSLDIQIGYCNGNTHSLSALEYHKSPEVNIAITPLVLLLATPEDIVNNRVDSSKVKAFYLEKGTVIELYSNVLHFAPCSVSRDGFKCVVILNDGTNSDLEISNYKDKLLFKKNKWLLVHKEREDLINAGGEEGIDGPNIQLNY